MKRKRKEQRFFDSRWLSTFPNFNVVPYPHHHCNCRILSRHDKWNRLRIRELKWYDMIVRIRDHITGLAYIVPCSSASQSILCDVPAVFLHVRGIVKLSFSIQQSAMSYFRVMLRLSVLNMRTWCLIPYMGSHHWRNTSSDCASDRCHICGHIII